MSNQGNLKLNLKIKTFQNVKHWYTFAK